MLVHRHPPPLPRSHAALPPPPPTALAFAFPSSGPPSSLFDPSFLFLLYLLLIPFIASSILISYQFHLFNFIANALYV
jgi:hypothetical protein